MVKMYFLCCSYRTRIKDHGIIKLRIAGLDKQINHSTRICIPIADWDSKKVQVKPRHEQAYILNKQISDLRSKVIDFIETRSKNLRTSPLLASYQSIPFSLLLYTLFSLIINKHN